MNSYKLLGATNLEERMFQVIKTSVLRKRRRNSGRVDILIIALIALFLVVSLALVILQIVKHSEEHVDTVRKTKIIYSESLSWRPNSQLSEDRVRTDFEKASEREQAEYGDLVLSEKSFKLIAKMTNLKNLKLTRAVFEPRWLAHLSHLPLKVIGLSGTPLNDEAIPYIVKMKDLESLDIGDTEVTDKGLEVLSSAKSIIHLDINHARCITNDGIKHIGEMEQLQKLELATCPKVTGKCLVHIVNLNNLAYLNLRDMKIGPGDLSHLSSLKKLFMIDLSNCNLSDPLVTEVAKIDSLYDLNIAGGNFTSKSLMELSKLKHLTRLVVKNCPKVDKSAVKQFQTILPGCTVKYSRSNGLSKKLSIDEYKMEVDFLKNEANTQLKRLKNSPK